MSELATKHCVPCTGGVPPLSEEQTGPLLAQLDAGWEIATREDTKHGTVVFLRRRYRFPDFDKALGAAVRVGAIAEIQNHHPDLLVAWGMLGVEIWTHKIGGLTESDFIFAAKCDKALR